MFWLPILVLVAILLEIPQYLLYMDNLRAFVESETVIHAIPVFTIFHWQFFNAWKFCDINDYAAAIFKIYLHFPLDGKDTLLICGTTSQ